MTMIYDPESFIMSLVILAIIVRSTTLKCNETYENDSFYCQ